MTTILTLFLAFVLWGDTQEELGLGIIQVDIGQTKEIQVFKNKGDKAPEKVIRLIKKEDDIVIEEQDYNNWLLPETIWLDYSQFLFRYTQLQDNWIEVIINKETGTKRWIMNSPTFKIIHWKEFLLKNTTAVEPITPTDIKAEPNSNAGTIRQSTDKDCFEVLEIRGDWMKIKTNETLECNEHPQPIKAGWINWKHNNKLAIRYYLAC